MSRFLLRGVALLLGVVMAGAAPAGHAATNWALASNGASATASSQYDAGSYAAAKAIDGSRVGTGNVNYWNDGTGGVMPDWLQVTFSSARSINEISVFTLQDNLSTPSAPTEAMTVSAANHNQPTAFEVQYWDGSAWQTISGGSVTGNNKVWRKFYLYTPITTTSVRVHVTAANGSYTAITELEAWEGAPEPPYTPLNVAAAANGGKASASSQYSAAYGAAKAIDGDRKTDGYNDANPGVYPDWLRVDFSGAKSINEINVFTLQDNYSSPADPTEDMTFTLWGIIDFEVQYWDGAGFVNVPGGSVTGNNKVWRKFTFSPLTTSAIRVNVTNAMSYTRIVELEAMEAPPPGPSNLTATAVSGTQIDLTWTDTTATETGFQIERKTGTGGTYALIATAAANATSYQDSGLSPLTSYYYRVRATTPSGPTLHSNEANATTQGAVAAPSDLTAVAASATQVNLTWTDNSGNETGFRIERKLGPTGAWAQIGTVGVNVTSYADTTASGLSLYYYRVLATSASGNSPYSNEASVMTPGDSPFANVYYIHNDHLNTPRAISNSTNTIVWRWDSDPFGATAPDEDPDGDSVAFEYNRRFPGQDFDKETNLHYNYFRDCYDPATRSGPTRLDRSEGFVRCNPCGL